MFELGIWFFYEPTREPSIIRQDPTLDVKALRRKLEQLNRTIPGSNLLVSCSRRPPACPPSRGGLPGKHTLAKESENQA